MIYVVKPGDTLTKILGLFNSRIGKVVEGYPFTTPLKLEDLLKQNVLCNPNLIFPNQVINYTMHYNDDFYMKTGIGPYYLVRPGDTLNCIAKSMRTHTHNYDAGLLYQLNQAKLQNPDLIYYGTDIIATGSWACEYGDFERQWYAMLKSRPCQELDREAYYHYYGWGLIAEICSNLAVPTLMESLQHPCSVLRYYALIALGRIAPNTPSIISAVQRMTADHALVPLKKQTVADAANYVLKKLQAIQKYGIRARVTTDDADLHSIEDFSISRKKKVIPRGTEIMVLQWHIPSGMDVIDEGIFRYPIYDYVKVLETGETGFLKRMYSNEIPMI